MNLTDLWFDVIERSGAGSKTATEFYQSNDAAAIDSRADFWSGVRRIINHGVAYRDKIDAKTKTGERLRLGITENKAVQGRSLAKKQPQQLDRKKQNSLSTNNRANQRKGPRRGEF